MTVEKSPRTDPPPEVALVPLGTAADAADAADPAAQTATRTARAPRLVDSVEPDGLPPDLPADGSLAPDDYRPFISASPDMTFVRTLDGVLRYVSPASRTLFGWTPAELEGHPEADFVHADDLSALEAGRAGLDTVRDHVTAVYRFADRRGSYRWTETSSRLVRGDTSWLVVSTMRDITERRRRTAALELQALTDPLTGVANRNVLMDRLRQGLRRLTRGGGVLAVLYLDLDRFKIVNDSYGHRVGDLILLNLAERLTEHLRPADTLARLGGDEFVIVAEGMASEEDAVGLGERMVEAARRPIRAGNEDFVCTLSIGVACTGDPARAPEELVREADLALYQAKERGRDRAEVFDDELRTRAVRRLVAGRTLRRALDEHGIVVDYQPVVDLRTRRPVGAQASARIDDLGTDPRQLAGLLGVGEETALLVRIDDQVLNEVIRHLAGGQSSPPARGLDRVAVTVTARHLAGSGFAPDLLSRVDRAGLRRDRLQIQVAERVLMEGTHSAMAGLRTLRQAGIRIGLDNFGSGYSSLAYLRQFPLDFVKLDPLFVVDLERGGDERALVGAIVALAHALGLSVVAEGVENEAQFRILESLECDRGQGPLFAGLWAPLATADARVPDAGASEAAIADAVVAEASASLDFPRT